MTQIVLHPRQLGSWGPYGGQRVMLTAPWMWWETRVAVADGCEFVIRYEPDADDIENYFLTFGADRDGVVLTDPPSLFLIHIQDVIDFDGPLMRSIVTSSVLTARVVWWTQPGPHWWPVPYVPTCRPGLYQQDSELRGRDIRHHDERRRDREWSDVFYQPMPNLDWPLGSMVVDGQTITAASMPLTADRCRQCQRYMPESQRGTHLNNWLARLDVRVLPPWQRELTAALLGPICPDCARMQQRSVTGPTGTVVDGVLTPNEVRRREGLPPLPGGDTYIQHPAPTILPGGKPPLSRLVKPESEVIDEIDRLVNEQVRFGPVDDYHVDRYPKCDECGHDFHGLDCACGCINTDWLQEKRKR
jgi:hypothetical protein